MKKVLISFADTKFYHSQNVLRNTATSVGKVDEAINYTQDWLRIEPFWTENSYILNKSRGAGYWIWKPYIVLKTFDRLQEGDGVIYTDAGASVIADLSVLYDTALMTVDKKVIFRNALYINKTWTKRDCFILMDCDESKYWEGPQIDSFCQVYIKTKENIAFLKEYLTYLVDPRIVTDDPNVCGQPNFNEFVDHRHDQSVLSLMCIKKGCELFKSPSQYGDYAKHLFTNSPWNSLFNHHRGNI
jgi:hypothetical protein